MVQEDEPAHVGKTRILKQNQFRKQAIQEPIDYATLSQMGPSNAKDIGRRTNTKRTS